MPPLWPLPERNQDCQIDPLKLVRAQVGYETGGYIEPVRGSGCRRQNQRTYWNFTQLLANMGEVVARSVSERRPNGKYGVGFFGRILARFNAKH